MFVNRQQQYPQGGYAMRKANRDATVRKPAATARAEAKKSVIGSRKACSASGTGLSHYILLGRKSR